LRFEFQKRGQLFIRTHNKAPKRDRILTALSEATDVSHPLTACAVITVMRASMVMMPNPRALDDWPEQWDTGIHYVRPLNLGRTIALIILSAVAVGAAIPLGWNKTAKE
jgi:hypothetical protein